MYLIEILLPLQEESRKPFPAELYERPATRFVAGFLGASNLLRGRAEGNDGELATVRLEDGAAVRIASSLLGARQRVDLGVRPEKIRLLEMSETAPQGANLLTGTITSALYTGVSTQYQVVLPTGTSVVVYEQNLERARAATPGLQRAARPQRLCTASLVTVRQQTPHRVLGSLVRGMRLLLGLGAAQSRARLGREDLGWASKRRHTMPYTTLDLH